MPEIIETKEDYAAIYDDKYYSGEKSFFYKLSGGYKDWESYFNRIARWFRPFVRKGTLLDAGCAYGFMLKRFRDTHSLVGCDVSEYALQQAAKLVPEARLEKVFLGKDQLPWADGSIDTILCNDVIEHLNEQDLAATLQDWFRVLKPGGRVCLTTPNGNWIRKIFYGYADKLEHHIGLRHLTVWLEMFEKAGYEIVDDWTYFHGLFPFRLKLRWFFAETAFIVQKPEE